MMKFLLADVAQADLPASLSPFTPQRSRQGRA